MKYKTDDSIYGEGTLADDHKRWPSYNLFEQFGEAIPQFVIGVTFYSKNYHWLKKNEVIFGVINLTLSVGSIVIGIVNGCIAAAEFYFADDQKAKGTTYQMTIRKFRQ